MTAAATEVTVPDIGDFDEVPVIEILVSVGDTVSPEDPLVTLESDKATMDVPAPRAGVVREISVRIGDRVSQGTRLLTLEDGNGAAPASAAATPPATEPASAPAPSTAAGSGLASATALAQAATAAPDADQPTVKPIPEMARKPGPEASGKPGPEASGKPGGEWAGGPAREPTLLTAAVPSAAAPAAIIPPAAASPGDGSNGASWPIYASPSARRVARELGVDLHSVQGSGRGGRITRDDVQRLAAQGGAPASASPRAAGAVLLAGVPPWPVVDFERYGPVERVTRSRIQRISAPNLARNWIAIPHVTHNDEADITELETWRRQLNEEHASDGVKFTMVTFLIAASVASLKRFPEFNSSLDGDELILKRYWNIGFAADTPGGLVVPVIKGADGKGLKEIARELTGLSGRAREGKLSPGDMSGSTFTISSLGGIGGTSFTPIINAPEVAILGVTRAATKPVWNGSEFEPRLMLPLSLSYDHRVIDGAAAARFTAHLAGVLSDLRRALL